MSSIYNLIFSIFFLITIIFIIQKSFYFLKIKLNEINTVFGIIILISIFSTIVQLILYLDYNFFFNNKLILQIIIKIIITSISFYCFYKFFKKKSLFKNFLSIDKSVVNIYLIILIICSFSIPIEGDSLIYHLKLPKLIIEGYRVNQFIDNIHIILIGNFELFNIFPMLIEIDNINSLINALFLVLLANYIKKQNYINNKNFFLLLILSSPILIGVILTQKPFLIPLITQIFFCEVNFKKKFNNNKETIISFIALFASMGIKLNFIISGGLIMVIYFFYYYKDILNFNFLHKIFLSFFFILLPIFIFRYVAYNDPLAPFLNFLPNEIYNKNILINFSESLKNWNKNEFFFPINLFLSNKIMNMNNTLGFGLIIILFQKNIIHNNKIFLVSIILFLSNIIFVQQTARFFLLPFLLLLFSLNLDKIKFLKFFKILFTLNLLVLLSIVSIFYLPAVIKITFLNDEKIKEKIIFRYKTFKTLENIIGTDKVVIIDNPNYYSKNTDIGRMIMQYANNEKDLIEYKKFLNKQNPEFLLLTENSIQNKKFFNLYNKEINNFFMKCFKDEISRFSINRASRKNLILDKKEKIDYFLYKKKINCKF